MGSRKEEKAEGAARYAADELKSSREERESYNTQQHVRKDDNKDHYAGVGGISEETHTQQQNRPGLISSVFGALGSTYEHAKEAVTGKTHDAAEKTKETAGVVSESMKESHDVAAVRAREDAARAREGKDNAAENLKQTKDYTVGKTKDTAGYVADRAAVQAKDVAKDNAGYAADKAAQAKDATVGKTKDTAGYVADKATQAKDVTVGKTKDSAGYVADKAVQAKDVTVGKTKDTAGYVANKVGQAKDTTVDAAQQAKDAAAEKARVAADKTGEYTDYTAEKAVEGKDTAVGKLGELKDSAVGAAQRAMGFLGGKKDEAKDKVGETAEVAKEKTVEATEAAKQKGREAMDSAQQTAGAAKNKAWVKKEDIKNTNMNQEAIEEDARRKKEEMRIGMLREKGYDVENEATEESAGIRGEKNNILGAIGSVTEAMKNKLTMPGNAEDEERRTQGKSGEGTVSVTIEESPPGAAIDLLKKADQITGQGYTPNDVGKMGEEGTGKPGRPR
ncbi:Late embryogenesis abundant protein ECP63 [Bienertia sinuspersici]